MVELNSDNTRILKPNQQHGQAVWLRREGNEVVVLLELDDGGWLEIIREQVDTPFSHIWEGGGW